MLARARLFSICTEVEMATIADNDLHRAARIASTLRILSSTHKMTV